MRALHQTKWDHEAARQHSMGSAAGKRQKAEIEMLWSEPPWSITARFVAGIGIPRSARNDKSTIEWWTLRGDGDSGFAAVGAEAQQGGDVAHTIELGIVLHVKEL